MLYWILQSELWTVIGSMPMCDGDASQVAESFCSKGSVYSLYEYDHEVILANSIGVGDFREHKLRLYKA